VLSTRRVRIILIIMLFVCLKGGTVLAQERSNKTRIGDVPKARSRFGLGFYAGVNDPLNEVGRVSDLGPSFMVFGSYKISERWQAEIGFGGVFYYGKSLGYRASKNIYDTVYAKNYTVTGLAYTSVPVIIRYSLNKHIGILFGLRWQAVSGVFGNGSYGIYSPVNKDSFIFKSNIIPSLPKGADFLDMQGLAGLELAFSRHFAVRLMVNIGFIPVYPGNLTNIIPPLYGNYNDSIELGFNYNFFTL